MITRLLLLLHSIRRRRGWTAGGLTALVMVAILGCAIVFHLAEGRHRDPALTFGDALWFSVVSITTVGYGDLYPTTAWGRAGVIIFTVLLGLGSFTVFLGVLVDAAGSVLQKGRRGMLDLHCRNHVLIVHYPSERRVRQILTELAHDDRGSRRDIALVTEQIDELPPELEGIHFVRGSPLNRATMERANVMAAGMAIVLATSYSDPNSDAVVASAVTILKSVNPELFTVAELLDEDRRELFKSARCDSIVPAFDITGSLLVQESQDRGVSQLVEVITSNRVGADVFSARLANVENLRDYRSVARRLIDADVNLVAVSRDRTCHTAFGPMVPREDDVLLYLAAERLDEAGFQRLLSGLG